MTNEATDARTSFTFTWRDEDILTFCDICVKFIINYGRKTNFRWNEILKEFEETSGRQCAIKSLKNKYDTLKKDWRHWKFLKNGETGLGWDSVSGKLSCSDEWWNKKIQEQPQVKKIRNKGINSILEDRLSQLFDDGVATGYGCVAPGLSRRQTINMEDEENGDGDYFTNEENVIIDQTGRMMPDDDAYYTQEYYSQMNDGVEGDGQPNFFRHFMNEVNSEDPRQPPNTTTNTPLPVQLKRKRRQSMGSAKLSNQIDTLVTSCTNVYELMKDDNTPIGCMSTQAKDEISTAIKVVSRLKETFPDRMSRQMTSAAMSLIHDAGKREVFLQSEDEDRLAWLEDLSS